MILSCAPVENTTPIVKAEGGENMYSVAIAAAVIAHKINDVAGFEFSYRTYHIDSQKADEVLKKVEGATVQRGERTTQINGRDNWLSGKIIYPDQNFDDDKKLTFHVPRDLMIAMREIMQANFEEFFTEQS